MHNDTCVERATLEVWDCFTYATKSYVREDWNECRKRAPEWVDAGVVECRCDGV